MTTTKQTQLFKEDNTMFPVCYTKILERVNNINGAKYGSTRNYINGAVTYLSPYISRGVISTKLILSSLLSKGYKPITIEKLIQELAWRDYWQQVWVAKKEEINNDLKHKQNPVLNTNIATAIVKANTGIYAIDNAIKLFYNTGYLHNHLRMYIASIACNIAKSHWYNPAQWMYYHLLDADWASNALSWQWVAGANANKKYVANQANINTYCFTKQRNTFLDVAYHEFATMQVPKVLTNLTTLDLKTSLPKQTTISLNETLPTYIYNFYNLDPNWGKEILANRILLLEPSHFKTYPISQKTLNFIIDLATTNLSNIQIFIGEFNDLMTQHRLTDVYYKEHPLSTHYVGTEVARDWMFSVQGYYPSFFAFWKRCKKELNY